MNWAFVMYMFCTYYKAVQDTEFTPSVDMIHMS